MGVFSKLFKNKDKPKNTKYAEMLDGFMPIFSQFGKDIYVSDVVQQAVNCIVSEMKKLNPMHIRKENNDVIPVDDSLQRVLKSPNELMTTSDFIEKIMWQLMANYNAFIVPSYTLTNSGVKIFQSLTPIAPTDVEFLQDPSERLFVKFSFRNGYVTDPLLYSDILHIRSHYSVNDFLGGNEFGQPDNRALLKTLELNDSLFKGILSAMKSSYAINGIVKFNTMIDDGKTEKALKKLEEKLRNSESGFLPLDMKSEFTPIKKEIALIDNATLKFVDEKILRHFGVPLCILTGDFTTSQLAAFYQKTLEPLIISLSQAFTKSLFSPRERSFGNEIVFYPEEMIFMDTNQKLQMVNMLSNTGALYENEKRTAFGKQPLPELVGKRYMSLNWVDVDYAAQYQLEGRQPRRYYNTNTDTNENNKTEEKGEI